MIVANTKVPTSAAWLGSLGALPFVGLAGMMPLSTGDFHILISHALAAYGATILSFLGGVHWGLAIASRSSADEGALPARLTLSVLPPLIGWAALVVGSTYGLLILAVATGMMLWVDIRATRIGHAPLWYRKLRIPLTCVVVAALLFAAVAQGSVATAA